MRRKGCQGSSLVGSKSQGFSLVELMISVTLGLLVISAVISVFLGSRKSFRTSEGVSQMQEEGRFASLLITPIIRQAGYLPDPIFTQTDPTAIFSLALNKTAIRGFNDTSPTIYPGLTSSTVEANTDSIAISFMGKDTATPPDTAMKTCLGDDVSATQIAVNVFFISQAGSNGVQSLNCYTNISLVGQALSLGTQRNEPLIAGVSNLQILYGIDTDGDRITNIYSNAAGVADWTQVTAIKLTVTIDSADQVNKGAADTVGVVNGRIRRNFSTVLQIRNRLTAPVT